MDGVFAGIDAGSTTTKVVLVSAGAVVACAIAATGANVGKTARTLYDGALRSAGRVEDDVTSVMTTGYGRRLVDFRTGVVSEITANAAGARFVSRDAGRVRTIIDVGGQDSKAIALDEDGRVVDFAMNDKCAAGTGRFLEVMARIVELDLDAIGEVALQSETPRPITSLCTVFAESEVVGLLSAGVPVPDIVAGIHASIAARVGALVRRVGLRTPVLFDGGAALNPGLRRALEDNLDVPLVVPERPRMVTATGAALIARDRRDAT